jgi:hypothetical protein
MSCSAVTARRSLMNRTETPCSWMAGLVLIFADPRWGI